jgi:hypothetical protein
MKRAYQTPDGVVKMFEVDEAGAGAPPPPWRPTAAPPAPIDPEKQEKSDLATAIEALGGRADQRRSIDHLRAQLEELEKAQDDGDDGA